MNTSITRDRFAILVEIALGDKLNDFLDKIIEEKEFTTFSYKVFLVGDTVYIIDLYNEELITWYKPYHVGRALKITKDDADDNYITQVFTQLKEELLLNYY